MAGVSSGAWSLLGRPWIALLAPVVVGTLQVMGVGRAPLSVFFDRWAVRDLLGLLWQVEAAAIALVLAASLFAFESLTRQRSNIPLVDYANRSRLTQFLMLAAAGLLAIPVALFATPGLPDPSASFAAAAIGLMGLVALPFFIVRAMRVVHPSWLRSERLKDVESAIRGQVHRDAFERASVVELTRWATENGARVGHRMLINSSRVTELADSPGAVLDIDLDRLESTAKSQPDELVVGTRLGERVWAGAALIGRLTSDGPLHPRRAVTISRVEPQDDMDRVVSELHEEALESVRRGSAIAADQVAATYAETWLAWPQEWAQYGQRLEGGLLGGLEPFRIGPTDDLKRNIATTVQLATDQGMRDHVHAFEGLLWRVGFEAVRLQALDLISEMNTLARWLLTTRSHSYPDLASIAREKAWRFQIELCEYAGRTLDSDEAGVELAEMAAAQVRECFSSLIESLRLLFDAGHYETFRQLDNRFRKILEYWDPSRREALARQIVEDPERFGADDASVGRARTVLELEKIRADLDKLRRGGRLAVLGWILRSGSDLSDIDVVDVVRELAGTLGPVSELMDAAGWALDDSREFMSRWTALDQPELEAGFIDTEGPILRALAASLLSRSEVRQIPPFPWITEGRTQRFEELVEDVAGWSHLWNRLGESLEDVEERRTIVVNLMRSAEQQQRDREDVELIERELDASKVQAFRASVVDGWREHRVLPDLAERTNLDVGQIPESEWTGDQFGFRPQLDPKGLFVTPTNWVGLEDNGRERGRNLAQSEVTAIVRQMTAEGQEVEAVGEVSDRLTTLLAQLRGEGYEPSLIVLPIDWRLARSLGLESWRHDVGRGGLGPNLKGSVDQVPVIDWWEVPENQIFAVDLERFCEVREAVGEAGESQPPAVSVEKVDEKLADEIISGWGPGKDPEDERERRRRVLTSVRTRILRPFEVKVLDGNAVRFVRLPDEMDE